MIGQLPEFVKPMLARTGEPFDSDEHLFEIKWDGLRTAVYVSGGAYQLRNRRGTDVTHRYPEFHCFESLPEGTILDGEVVVLDQQGKPNFRRALQREQAQSTQRVRAAARSAPAIFVAFDQLFEDYEPLISAPLRDRRQVLLETVQQFGDPVMIASDGVIGPGKAFFQEVVAKQLEGLVAKHLDSRYLAGARSDAWIKIRKRDSVLCAIVGYIPKGDDFESLVLASDHAGDLQLVGRVGNGFDSTLRKQLIELFRSQHCDQPLIPCGEKAQWLNAGLYCSVTFLEWTDDGQLREPVFERLVSA